MVLRELIICSGVGFSLFILFSRERVVRQVVFLNSGFMAASFIYSQLYHSFGKFGSKRPQVPRAKF